MPQQTQPVSQETKQVRETVIVTAPQEDISRWKRYAVTYYKRSRNSASPAARTANLERYLEYKELLENAGHEIIEGETLTIQNHKP